MHPSSSHDPTAIDFCGLDMALPNKLRQDYVLIVCLEYPGILLEFSIHFRVSSNYSSYRIITQVVKLVLNFMGLS